MPWVIDPFTGKPIFKLSQPPVGGKEVKNIYVDSDENLAVEYYID